MAPHRVPPFTLDVDPRRQIAIITWAAPLPTIELSRAAVEALSSRPDFQPHFGVVSDWRLARAAPEPVFVRQFLTTLEARRAAGHLTGRWATVVPDAAAIYGMARMTELLSEKSTVWYRAFLDFDEALGWVRGV